MPPEQQTQQSDQTQTTQTSQTTQTQADQTKADQTQQTSGETPEQKAAREAADKTKQTQETPEQKTAREAKERADAANDTKKNPFKPDEIKFQSKDIQIAEPVRDEFVKLINEEGLPRPLVQKLIALQEKATIAASESMNKQWTDLQTGWRSETEKDADIGGVNLQANLGLLSKAIDMYAGKMKVDPAAVRQAFDTTGAGDNPLITKLLVGMAKDLVKEGTAVPAAVAAPEASLAAKIYTKGLQKE